jgi:fucose permease
LSFHIGPLASTLLIGSLAAFLMKPPRSEKGGAVTGALATFVAMIIVIVGSFLIDSLIDPYAPTLHLIVSREVRFSQFTYDALCSGISLFCGALAGAFVGRCFPGLPAGK